jgi:EmrB/QacA subfamily drug resistance transporter
MDTLRSPSAEAHPRHGRGWALVTLCIAVLVAQLDTAVVNLALRPIGEHFHAPVSTLQWVADSYNLVYAALLLSGGLLADLLGRRRVFLAGLAVFTVGSAVCAFAPSAGVLIGARAITGVGAALSIPASLALVRVVWTDPAQRSRALGIWAACNGVAMGIGPTLGGVLIHLYSWRAVFLVVVPLGILALLLTPRALPESSDPQDRDFDLAAQLLGATSLGALAYAAIVSSTRQLPAIAMALLAAVAMALFLRIERRRGQRALVPLEIFRLPPFRAAVVATTGMTFGMYGVLFLVPLTWQSSGRFDPTHAGLALIPMAAVFVMVSPASHALTRMLGRRFMTSGGLAIIGAGLLTIGLFAHAASLWPAEIGLMLAGLGMGLATGPLMDTAVSAVGAARSGTASALINTARMIGATLGVAVLGALYALRQGGVAGLAVAMLAGGAMQCLCAATAAHGLRGANARKPADNKDSAGGALPQRRTSAPPAGRHTGR